MFFKQCSMNTFSTRIIIKIGNLSLVRIYPFAGIGDTEFRNETKAPKILHSLKINYKYALIKKKTSQVQWCAYKLRPCEVKAGRL